MDYIEACGDCFYLAMELALSEAEGWHPFYAVSTMREVVASHMTQETFDLYSLLHRQKAEGFAFMQGLESLEALRKRVRLRGQQVGAHKSVWADGFAMETISNHFCLLLLIVDERFQGSSKFTRIAPRGEGSTSEEANLQSDQATVLLHSSSREHMNLIRYGGKKLLQLGSLPLELQAFWGRARIRARTGTRPRRPTAAASGASQPPCSAVRSDSCSSNNRSSSG